MGLGKVLKKATNILAPVKNIGRSSKALVQGDVKGALTYGTRAALAPISQPAQILRGAPVLGGLANRLPGANRINAGADRLFGNPNAQPPTANPMATAALNALAAGNLTKPTVGIESSFTPPPPPVAAPGPLANLAGGGPPPAQPLGDLSGFKSYGDWQTANRAAGGSGENTQVAAQLAAPPAQDPFAPPGTRNRNVMRRW